MGRYKSVNSSRLERWLGWHNVAALSTAMRGAPRWYGPPIAVHGVPGRVFVANDGEFFGDLRAGYETNAFDRAHSLLHRFRRAMRRASAAQAVTLNAGFASLSDLIANMTTAGQRREMLFRKSGPAASIVGGTHSLWGLSDVPAAGANASAAPGGDAPTDATTGAYLFANPTGGDTLHFINAYVSSSVALHTVLLYDRIFQVNKTMASTATQSVTGVPTRYQSSTAGAADYAAGNFAFVEVGVTNLSATAHDWTVCRYRNQAGTDAQSFPSMTGNSGAVARRLDHPLMSWFMPLAAGDTGVMDLDQMQCSASVAAGVINFVVGHPIAWLPCPLANLMTAIDGVGTALNLVRVFDDAALAMLLVNAPTTAQVAVNGQFTLCAG